ALLRRTALPTCFPYTTLFRSMLDQLAGAGWLDRDEDGRVTGAAGLSLTTGPHRIALDGTDFRTWCAYDAIGIAAALGADAAIRRSEEHTSELQSPDHLVCRRL